MIKVLCNANFRWLWLSQVVSQLGDEIRTWSVVFWVYMASGQSPLVQSLILAANIAPRIILGPLAGVLVDRWNRKMMIMHAEIIRSALALALIPAIAIDSPQLVLLLVAGSAAAAQFSQPAYAAMLPSLIPREDYMTANSLRQTSKNALTLLGPVVGSGMYYLLGPVTAFALNAIGSVAAVVSLVLVPYSGLPEPQSFGLSGWVTFWKDFAAGLRHAWEGTLIRTLLFSFSTMSFAVGTINVLNIVFVTKELGLSQQYTAWATSAIGTGAVGTAVIAGVFSKRISSHNHLYVIGIGVLTAGVFLLAASPNAVIMLGSQVAIGAGVTLISVAASTLFMVAVPDRMLGRVGATLNTTSTLSTLVSALTVGYVAQGVSTRLIFVGSGLLVGFSTIHALISLRTATSLKANGATIDSGASET